MKNSNYFRYLLPLAFLVMAQAIQSQSIVSGSAVERVDIDLRTNPVLLDSVTLTLTEPGKVLVRFDGYLEITPGDKVFIAVSDHPLWGATDDNVNLEVQDADISVTPFAHSRVYTVSPGTHTFYAVAHNYIELDGSGFGSVRGHLLAEFFADSDDEFVVYNTIVAESKQVRGAPFTFATTTVFAPEDGRIKVTFDGLVNASVGDLIVLAATDDEDWTSFGGGVLVEPISGDVIGNSFSHSRVYDVAEGSHTFYAVAENVLEQAGNGRISVFGSFTAVYYPGKIDVNLDSEDVTASGVDTRDTTVIVAVMPVSPTAEGKVIAHYSGMVELSAGDRVELAINNAAVMPASASRLALEAFDADHPYRSVSITRVMEAGPGAGNFYLLARNSGETGGNGTVSLLGNFSLVYRSSEVISASSPPQSIGNLTIYPNPVRDFAVIRLDAVREGPYSFEIIDLQGRILFATEPSMNAHQMLATGSLPSGMYFVRVTARNAVGSAALVKQ